MNSIDFYRATLKNMIEFDVEFMIVGGYAVNSYGFMRSTGDMDLWVSSSENNFKKLHSFFLSFHYSENDVNKAIEQLKIGKNVSLIESDFYKVEIIPILSSIISFADAFKRKEIKKFFGLQVPVVGFDDLCNLKIKSGRDKDLLDVKELKRIRDNQ